MVGHSIHYDAIGKTAGYEGFRYFSSEQYGTSSNHKHFIGLGHLGFSTQGTGWTTAFTAYRFTGGGLINLDYDVFSNAVHSYQNAYNSSIMALDIIILNMTICNTESSGVDGRLEVEVRGQYSDPSDLAPANSGVTNDVLSWYWVPYGTSLTLYSKSNPLYIPYLGNADTVHHYLAVRSIDGPRMDITFTYALVNNPYSTNWTGSGYGV